MINAFHLLLNELHIISYVLNPLSAWKVQNSKQSAIHICWYTVNAITLLVEFMPTTKRHSFVASLYENVVQYKYLSHNSAHSVIFANVTPLFSALFGNNSVANLYPIFIPPVRCCVLPEVVLSVNKFTTSIRITFVNNVNFRVFVS